MTGHGSKSCADDTIAVVLAAGCPVAIAARAAGVSESTVHRRLRSRKFRRRVQVLRSRAVEMAVGRVADGMTDAANELRQLLRNDDPKIRLAAARSLLGIGADLWKAVDQQSMIDDLADKVAVWEEERKKMQREQKEGYE